MLPAAPVSRTRFMLGTPLVLPSGASAGLARPLGELAIALEAPGQVRPHGTARLAAVTIADGFGDAPMLLLNARQIAVLLGSRSQRGADAVSRDHVLPQKREKQRELRVGGGIGDGTMKGKILVDGALAAIDRGLDLGQRLHDGGDLPTLGALGGQRGGFDLDRNAQLHDVQHVANRAQAIGIDAKGRAAGVGGDEGSRALPRRHQPLRTQGGNGLAYHGAADAHGVHQLLLGRQPRAWFEPAAADFVGYPVDNLFGKVAAWAQRPQESRLVSRWRSDYAGNSSGHRTIVLLPIRAAINQRTGMAPHKQQQARKGGGSYGQAVGREGGAGRSGDGRTEGTAGLGAIQARAEGYRRASARLSDGGSRGAHG